MPRASAGSWWALAREPASTPRLRAWPPRRRASARELSARTLCWIAPEQTGAHVAAALVEGTVLADYRFERFKSVPQAGDDGVGEDERPKHLERLLVSSPQELGPAVSE